MTRALVISIGILAYNEEQSIARTIASTLSQKLDAISKKGSPVRAELIVVPNGCKDRTAENAHDAVHALTPAKDEEPGFYHARVHELSEPGKENAWNHFVYEFSDPNADILVFMDADITLAHERVIYNLINTLIANPECVVAGGNPIKHIERKEKKSTLDRLSIGATSLRKGMKGIFAGCLYCGYADTMRSVYLPTVLMGEDAFVRAMIVTGGFTHEDNPNLIIRADDAEVIFESYTRFGEVLRNKTRRMLEITINAIIYTKLWAESTAKKPAGVLMKELQTQDPEWSQKLVKQAFESRGFWAVPKSMIFKQFLQLRLHPLSKKFKLLPTALATLPLNTIAVVRANRCVARGEIRSLWNKSG